MLIRWIPIVTGAILVSVLTGLGLWQWQRGQHRLADLEAARAMGTAPVFRLDGWPTEPTSLAHARVEATGEYDAEHQVLIDNQVYGGRAGFHVVTPLRIDGGDTAVLVNRGWIPLGQDRRELPDVVIPAGRRTIAGTVKLPPQQLFSLERDRAEDAPWEPVWQHLDLRHMEDAFPYPVLPIVVQLDPGAEAGFVRDWARPDARQWVARHRAYALQWFALAAAVLGVWGYTAFRRIRR